MPRLCSATETWHSSNSAVYTNDVDSCVVLVTPIRSGVFRQGEHSFRWPEDKSASYSLTNNCYHRHNYYDYIGPGGRTGGRTVPHPIFTLGRVYPNVERLTHYLGGGSCPAAYKPFGLKLLGFRLAVVSCQTILMTQKVCFGFWVSRGGDALVSNA
jgi:hypothetical protein